MNDLIRVNLNINNMTTNEQLDQLRIANLQLELDIKRRNFHLSKRNSIIISHKRIKSHWNEQRYLLQ